MGVLCGAALNANGALTAHGRAGRGRTGNSSVLKIEGRARGGVSFWCSISCMEGALRVTVNHHSNVHA